MKEKNYLDREIGEEEEQWARVSRGGAHGRAGLRASRALAEQACGRGEAAPGRIAGQGASGGVRGGHA